LPLQDRVGQQVPTEPSMAKIIAEINHAAAQAWGQRPVE
jgi:hypothetical protein